MIYIYTNNIRKPNPKQNIIGPARSESSTTSFSSLRSGFNEESVF